MRSLIIFILVLSISCYGMGQQKSFTIIPLGVKGGLDEADLSAYMVAAAGTTDFICLDAGTLHAGIQRCITAGIFKSTASSVLRRNIKGYLISHAHLDHIAGLIINAPDDTVKNIYGLPACLNIIKDKYFTWKSWANFADQGERPLLNTYHYQEMTEGEALNIPNTTLAVTAFPLSHVNPYESTAFLVRNHNVYLLYLGDTGADTIEKSDKLELLWKKITPLIQAKQLKAIFIEVSYPNEQPQQKLFGHLTPALLIQELKKLASFTGVKALYHFPIVITHIKPPAAYEVKIKKQLLASNELQLQFIFARQADKIEF